MKIKLDYNKNNIILFLTRICLLLFVICKSDMFFEGSMPIVVAFLVFYILLIVFPKRIRSSIPMIIIEITGAIRYVLLPIIMKNEYGVAAYSKQVIIIMILELIAIYIGIIIYTIRNKEQNEVNYENKSTKIENTEINAKIGISAIIILIIGGGIVLTNRSFLEQYFSFSTNKNTLNNIYAGFSIIVNCFFILMFIYSLNFIKKIRIKNDFLKVGLSVILSAFFVNGTSISADNVSRWTMLITAIISYTYISILYPRYKRVLSGALIGVLIFTISIGSLLKFNDKKGFDSLNDTLNTQLKYKELNAYFAGSKNMKIGEELKNSLESGQIDKGEMIVSDIFANFPILNHYFSNAKIQLVTLFNYKYYNSYVAKDQIIPYSIQMYIYLDMFFVIAEVIQIYYAFKWFFYIKREENFLKIYCLVYGFFSFCLVNCINFSIMLQNIWIHILPVYVIYRLNIRNKRLHK